MRPGALGEVGGLHVIRNGRELLVATYAEPCTGTLHTRVPLPSWPNAAANSDHYFGPLEGPCSP